MHGSPSLLRGDTKNASKSLQVLDVLGITLVDGNVGISTAHRLSILEIPRIVHTIHFIL